MSDLDLDRVAWIDERVNNALVSYGKIRDNYAIRFDACQILGVVEEFAELLRVHYAGGDA